MKQLFVLTLAAVSLLGADATGTWTGSLLVMRDGAEQSRPAHLVLKQEGTKLTGTAGPDGGEQHQITDGQVTGEAITFSVVRDEGPTMKFTLKQEGDEIKGEITRERDGQREIANIIVKRQK
jgi:hypothetical protein